MSVQPVPGRIGAPGLKAVLQKDVVPEGDGLLVRLVAGPAFQQFDGLQHQNHIFPHGDAGVVPQYLLHRLTGRLIQQLGLAVGEDILPGQGIPLEHPIGQDKSVIESVGDLRLPEAHIRLDVACLLPGKAAGGQPLDPALSGGPVEAVDLDGHRPQLFPVLLIINHPAREGRVQPLQDLIFCHCQCTHRLLWYYFRNLNSVSSAMILIFFPSAWSS